MRKLVVAAASGALALGVLITPAAAQETGAPPEDGRTFGQEQRAENAPIVRFPVRRR